MKPFRPSLVALLLAFAAPLFAEEPRGLLPVTLLTPRFSPFLFSAPAEAPPPPSRARLSLSAGTGQVWKGDAGPGGSVGISAQTVRYALAGRWSLTAFLETGLTVSVLHHARSFKKADEPFHLHIRYAGVTLADAQEPTCGLADPRFFLAAFHRDAKGPLRLVRTTLVWKVPSERRRGFQGTGRHDVGVFLDATFEVAKAFFLHGSLGAVLVGDPAGLQGGRVPMENAVPFRAGLEWRIPAGPGVYLQIEGGNGFYPDAGHVRLDEHPVQITLGVSLEPAPGSRFYLAFSEDVTRGAPDFAVHGGVDLPLP